MDSLVLLNILADGRFHSGDELGRALGVSRAAVWKAVKGFAGLGLEVHSVQGKGYRLAFPLELLDQAQILQALDEDRRVMVAGLDVLASVDSTNSLLLRRLQKRELSLGAGRVHACLAEQQSAGRGRRGRTWISPFGCNMYLSVLKEFAGGAMSLEGLSLSVGLALVRALQECGVSGLGLKWPNDILWQDRKLAGILLEMNGDVCGECRVVIGLGLNIHSPGGPMQAVDQPWVDLRAISPSLPGRNWIVGRVLNHLLGVLQEFEGRGFAPFAEEWRCLDIYRDRPVALRTAAGQPEVTGLARGVTAQGALKLETAAGIKIFNGGELSLRGGTGQPDPAAVCPAGPDVEGDL